MKKTGEHVDVYEGTSTYMYMYMSCSTGGEINTSKNQQYSIYYTSKKKNTKK
jgi:plastocyanin domain-containing protein